MYLETDGVITSKDITATAVTRETLQRGKRGTRWCKLLDTVIFCRAIYCFLPFFTIR